MAAEEPKAIRRLLPGLVSAVIAVGFLCLVTYLTPSEAPSSDPDPGGLAPRRQQVVLFLVDTSDAFDAHGLYVQSVIQQQCPRCSVQPVNLHGDLSLPTIVQALAHIRTRSTTYTASTTLLINLSLGTYTADAGLHAVVRQLDSAGVLLIASAGNDNTNRPFYPAAFPEVLGVCSSTRYSRSRAAYSNFGPWVSLCAPGWQYVTQPLEHGSMASGTSFASPMVAGALGQLLLDAPCATPRMGRQSLLRTADPLGPDTAGLGAGILNAEAAAHYLHSLYACNQPQPGFWAHGLTRLRRLSTRALMYIGLVVYFFVSIFALPFLVAFLIERSQQRAVQRQQQAMQQAYAGSPAYRRQRLLALKQRHQRTGKVRWYEQEELAGLVRAAWLYDEPCGWCERVPAPPIDTAAYPAEARYCQRCGADFLAQDTS